MVLPVGCWKVVSASAPILPSDRSPPPFTQSIDPFSGEGLGVSWVHVYSPSAGSALLGNLHLHPCPASRLSQPWVLVVGCGSTFLCIGSIFISTSAPVQLVSQTQLWCLPWDALASIFFDTGTTKVSSVCLDICLVVSSTSN